MFTHNSENMLNNRWNRRFTQVFPFSYSTPSSSTIAKCGNRRKEAGKLINREVLRDDGKCHGNANARKRTQNWPNVLPFVYPCLPKPP